MRWLALRLIELYQRTLSPDHGWFRALYPYGYCKFNPSCSTYTHDAISHHGVIKGGILGLRRIMRCNPWTVGGTDPVPEQ